MRLLVAYAVNRVIGRDGDLPWHLPSDLRRFKELTLGGTVVMGRKTWDSLPDAVRPLPGRRNVVLSRDPSFTAPGADVAAALPGGDAWVIGGASVYAAALPSATHVYATEIASAVDGDTFFPELGDGWRVTEESAPLTEDGLTFTFRTYAR